MNRATLESELQAQGYREIIDRRMPPREVNREHSHEFDAGLLVLEGELSILREGEAYTCRAGDTFAMAAGCRRAERSGAEGVHYLAGRRYRTKAAG